MADVILEAMRMGVTVARSLGRRRTRATASYTRPQPGQPRYHQASAHPPTQAKEALHEMANIPRSWLGRQCPLRTGDSSISNRTIPARVNASPKALARRRTFPFPLKHASCSLDISNRRLVDRSKPSAQEPRFGLANSADMQQQPGHRRRMINHGQRR